MPPSGESDERITMGTLITDLITPLSMELGVLGLADACAHIVLGARPPAKCLAVLAAQCCLETGTFQKMHRFNVGNRKVPADWDGLYTQFRCDEIFDLTTARRAQQLGPCTVAPWKGGPKQRVVLAPPHPWSSFAAFDTAELGMADHLKLLACTDRYRAAWSRAYAGDAIGTAAALHSAGYFTADLDPYARGMASLAGKLGPICQSIIGGSPLISSEDHAHIEQLVATTMAESRWGSEEPYPMEIA